MEKDQPKIEQNIEKEKKNYPWILIIALAVLAIGGIGFGVFEMLNTTQQKCIAKEEAKEKTGKTDEKTEVTPENISTNDQQKLFTNVVNNKDNNSYSKIEGVIYVSEDYMNGKTDEQTNYDLTCNSNECSITQDGKNIANITGFSGKIKDYYYAKFGQAYGQETLLFIMDDGSVEYLPNHEAFKNNNFKSRGKIAGLEKIIKIHQVSTHDQNGFGWITALAEDKDGNYYDLYYLLNY